MRRTSALLVALLLATGGSELFATGCSERDAPPTAEESSPPVANPAESAETQALDDDPPGLELVMRDHADRIDVARRALIRGQLEQIRVPMRWLSMHPSPEALPDDWRPKLEAMQRQARATGASTELSQAAHGLAQLTVTCSGCHAELNRGPGVPIDAPPAGEDLTQHMRRHDWAMERMWEGLVAGAGPMYQRGALALVEAPLHGDVDPDEEIPAGVSELANRVHDMGLEAHTSNDPATQVRLYGELLSTCATCHQLVQAELPR